MACRKAIYSIRKALSVGAEFIPPASIAAFRSEYRDNPLHIRHEVLETIATETDSVSFLSALLDQRRGGLDIDGSNGMGFLVDVRADALASCGAVSKVRKQSLQHVDSTLHGLLQSWMHPGHLSLERVTWSSPAALCERVATFERVHPSRSLSDLRERLGNGRRCFVLTHSSMPGIPLVMTHIALLREIPKSMHDVQHSNTEDAPTCAAFWSISATQNGLRGIDLGHTLIKRSVSELRRNFQTIERVCTLSPIPGFMRWLRCGENSVLADQLDNANRGGAFCKATNATASDLRSEALRQAECYLLNERLQERGTKSPTALCPVLNFHYQNGAQLYRLNWRADLSVRGMQNSAGIMANYVYPNTLEDLETNAVRYMENNVEGGVHNLEELAAEERLNRIHKRLKQIGRDSRW